MITPQAHFITDKSWNRWNTSRSSYGKTESKYEVKRHKTYRELKRNLREYCKDCIDSEGVVVYRTRKGQWGEWFEYWKADDNGKPFIYKQGYN